MSSHVSSPFFHFRNSPWDNISSLFEFDVESIFFLYKIYLREYPELSNKLLNNISETLSVFFCYILDTFLSQKM